jgi:16S rRNA (guanine527-N7)-methyltransferase
MSYNESRFIEGCLILNISPGEEQLRSLRVYAEELVLWNPRVALVGPKVLSSLEVHFLDSITPLAVIRSHFPPKGGALVDIGSGSGLPGVILAAFLPETAVTLLERSAKKAAFLRNVLALAGLSNAGVKEGELETEEGLYHGVVCKAFSSLSNFVFRALRITKPGGAIFAYKGRTAKAREELKELTEVEKLTEAEELTPELLSLKVPFLEEERSLVLIKRSDNIRNG